MDTGLNADVLQYRMGLENDYELWASKVKVKLYLYWSK
jgi:hypothetical protein